MDPINTNATNASSGSGARVVIPALLVVLLLVGGYFWFKGMPKLGIGSKTDNSVPGMSVTKTDLSASAVSKLPTGFPSDMPVETANIIESYKAEYQDYGVTQYTVRYTTDKSLDAVWKLYSDYSATNGYAIDQDTSKRAQGYLRATKGNNEFNITITKSGERNQVVVSYIARS